jgi:hypothetical protein
VLDRLGKVHATYSVGAAPEFMALDARDNLWVACGLNNALAKIDLY